MQVGPEAWVLAPEAAAGVAVAAPALLGGLAGDPFAGALERALEALRLRPVADRAVGDPERRGGRGFRSTMRISFKAIGSSARRNCPARARWFTYLRTTELWLDAEPRVAGPLSQAITVKLKLNLNGRLKDPWSLKLPRTGVDAALVSGPPTKAELRKVLGRMPRSVVTTAVVDLKSPTGIGPFHELLARHRLDRGGIPVFLEPDLRSMVDLRDRGGGIGTRVSWPDASVAQFQAWVKKLRGSDERLLADLRLPPRRVLRRLAAEPRIYAFVLDQASGQRLAGFLSDPAVRSIQLGDAAFDLGAAS